LIIATSRGTTVGASSLPSFMNTRFGACRCTIAAAAGGGGGGGGGGATSKIEANSLGLSVAVKYNPARMGVAMTIACTVNAISRSAVFEELFTR
jgi:hypothetical protein